jgi:hypothetical protein
VEKPLGDATAENAFPKDARIAVSFLSQRSRYPRRVRSIITHDHTSDPVFSVQNCSFRKKSGVNEVRLLIVLFENSTNLYSKMASAVNHLARLSNSDQPSSRSLGDYQS